MPAFRPAILFALALFCAAVPLRAQSNVGESAAFAFDTRDYTTGLSAESASFAFDTRIVDGLSGAGVSVSFAFDTRGATLPPLQITGILRDFAGMSVAGATIQIKRAGAIFWQGTTNASGTFTAPSLSGVNYTIIVTKEGYVTKNVNQAGTMGGNVAMNITLDILPAPPGTTAVNRTLVGTEVRQETVAGDPNAAKLLRFNGSQFVTDMSGLNPGRPTVILTHGRISSPNEWALALASLINNNHPGLPTPPNILAWDWHNQANIPVLNCSDVTPPQGLQLGKALQQNLGTGYSQRVHFIGHSLGALVNRYACDYVHASFTGNLSRDNPPLHWNSASTGPHITLLDEAEIAAVASTKVIASAALAGTQDLITGNYEGALVSAGIAAYKESKKDWKYPIPRSAWWVDNYISAVGLQHDDAVNVCLPAMALATGSGELAHSYAHLWYRNSVNPASVGALPPAIGYGLSYEATGTFPPNGYAGLTNGSLWMEDLGTADILDLALIERPAWNQATVTIGISLATPAATSALTALNTHLVQPLDAVGQGVMNGYQSTILWAGDLGGTVIYKTGQVVTATTEKVGRWWDAGIDKVTNLFDASDPDTTTSVPISRSSSRILLQKQTAAPAQNLSGSAVNQAMSSAAASPPVAEAPNAWMTIHVPKDAGMMAFDFTVTGDPVDDRIACAINGQNVFTLAAKFVSEGEPMSTDMIDVSAYASQDIELFFGLAGGTSTNCQVAIDGLRFITLPTPKVGVAVTGPNVAVKWPAAASGWVLESSETLAIGSWQPVPLGSGPAAQSGVLSIQEAVTGLKKFYRLRRSP